MKYLKYHQQYKLDNLQSDLKTSQMINEVFENDITWGGSLLGRLINSTIRVFKIGYNYTKVSSIVKSVKDEIYALLGEFENVENKDKIDGLKFKAVLTDIFEVVMSEESIKTKVEKLIGAEPLVDNAIDIVRKSKIEKKDELIKKLEEFKKLLEELKSETPDTDDTEKAEEETPEDGNDENIFYTNTKSLLQSILKIHYDIKNGAVKIQAPSVVTDDKEKTGTEDKSSTTTIKGKTPHSKTTQTQKSTNPKPEEKEEFDKDADKRAKELAKGIGKQSEPMSDNNSYRWIFNENVVIGPLEKHAIAGWKKIIHAYNKSGISKYIQNIESLLKIDADESVKEDEKKIVKTRILQIGAQLVMNLQTVGKPIQFSELIKERQDYLVSISDQAKSISLFSRILIAYAEDLGLLGSYGETGNQIKNVITKLSELKKLYPKIKDKLTVKKTESNVLSYSNFVMIREDEQTPVDTASGNDDPEEESDNKQLDDDIERDTVRTSTPNETSNRQEGGWIENADEVQKAWMKSKFKKGEENEWKFSKEDEKFRDEFEKTGDEDKELEDGPNNDHIIKIVNLFGKAYSLYATDYIPSGRPGGRVSQRTLREYEYIGKNQQAPQSSGDYVVPGLGPWAAKLPYNKFQDGITKILEDGKLRKVLANIKFVSRPEKSTGTPQEKPGSGKTLMKFINDMLNNEEGSFKKHRQVIFQKYFGVDVKDTKVDPKTGGPGKLAINKEEKGSTDEPYFSNQISDYNLLDKSFIKVRAKDGSVYLFYICPLKKGDVLKNNQSVQSYLFRFQKSEKDKPRQSIATNYIQGKTNGKNEKWKTDTLEDENNYGISYDSNKDVYLGLAVYESGNRLREGKDFEFKSINMSDIKNDTYTTNVEKITVSDIYFLMYNEEQKDGKQKSKKFTTNVVTKGKDRDLQDGGGVKQIAQKIFNS